MRKAILGLLLAAATIPAGAQPASAFAFKSAGVTGGITVSADFTACATVTFSGGGTIVGEFSAVGELQGPGTKVGTVRGSLPILATGSWSGCIPGAYTGATVGDGKFALDVHSTTDDYFEVQQCVVNRGALTCV
ncbi:MAG: hypothetical protein QOE45_1836 [Frankiaceae bacterium]|jgi:hypothetical protein|nr:hypothetical protein [Frankiaceae bacterium]